MKHTHVKLGLAANCVSAMRDPSPDTFSTNTRTELPSRHPGRFTTSCSTGLMSGVRFSACSVVHASGLHTTSVRVFGRLDKSAGSSIIPTASSLASALIFSVTGAEAVAAHSVCPSTSHLLFASSASKVRNASEMPAPLAISISLK